MGKQHEGRRTGHVYDPRVAEEVSEYPEADGGLLCKREEGGGAVSRGGRGAWAHGISSVPKYGLL